MERFARSLLCTLALSLLGSGALCGQERASWSLHAELDLYLGLKVGAEYHISDYFGIRGSLGLCLLSPTQISYTLVGVGHLRGPADGLQVDLEAGLVQAVFDVLEPVLDLGHDGYTYPTTYWMPGVCVALGYRSKSGHRVALRGGATVGFGYDRAAWQGPDLMPNLAVEYGYRKP